jgi:hypothetical protein
MSLNEEISNLTTSLNKLIYLVNKGDVSIRDHCDSVRAQIELVSNNLIKQVERNKNELLKKVDDYQKETLLTYNSTNNKQIRQQFDNKSIEIIRKERAFITRSLQCSKGTDQQLTANNAYLENKIICDVITKFESEIFNNKKLSFQQLSTRPLIGTISIEKMNSQHNTRDHRMIPLKSSLKTEIHNFKNLLTLENGKYFIDFNDHLDRSVIALFDNNFSLKLSLKMTSVLNFHDNFKATIYCECSSTNRIVLNHLQAENIHYLSILNDSFEIIRGRQCQKVYKSICSNSNRIVCLGGDDTLDIYDWNLNQLERKSGELLTDTFKTSNQIEIINEKLILKLDNKIIVIKKDEPNKVEATININPKTQMFIHNNNTIGCIIPRDVLLPHTQSHHECRLYNLKGKLLHHHDANLNDIKLNGNSFLIIKNKNIFVLDKISFNVYKYNICN